MSSFICLILSMVLFNSPPPSYILFFFQGTMANPTKPVISLLPQRFLKFAVLGFAELYLTSTSFSFLGLSLDTFSLSLSFGWMQNQHYYPSINLPRNSPPHAFSPPPNSFAPVNVRPSLSRFMENPRLTNFFIPSPPQSPLSRLLKVNPTRFAPPPPPRRFFPLFLFL